VADDRGATGPFDRELSIEQLIAEAGVERPVAECIVDGAIEQLGEEVLAPGVVATANEETVLATLTFTCILDGS
jgi:hypothetical protein